MSKTTITTIIPTFRRPELLRRAVESVQAQAFTDIKICIYDNASGDTTEAVVSELMKSDSRIHYVKRPINIGPGPSMVDAVMALDTRFFSLLNDDDFLLPEIYRDAMIAFDKCPEAGFVCAKTATIDVTRGEVQFRNRDWVAGLYPPSNEIASKMMSSHFVQTGVVMRTDITRIIGPFERLGNDVIYMTMAAASMPFVVLESYGSVFTFHPQSYTVAQGLTSEPEATLRESMLASVGFIVGSCLPDHRKFHLVMLIAHYYSELFDIKLVKELTSVHGYASLGAQQALPDRITSTSVALALYRRCPLRMQSALRLIMGSARSLLKRHRHSSWIRLPEEAQVYLVTGERDAGKFKSLMNNS